MTNNDTRINELMEVYTRLCYPDSSSWKALSEILDMLDTIYEEWRQHRMDDVAPFATPAMEARLQQLKTDEPPRAIPICPDCKQTMYPYVDDNGGRWFICDTKDCPNYTKTQWQSVTTAENTL